MPVRPICLPHGPKGSPLAGSEVLASGWGSSGQSRLGGPEEFPDELHSVRLRVMSKEECRNILRKSKISQHWTPNLICTLGKNRGPCKGDSGGPIVQKQGNQYILVQTLIEPKLKFVWGLFHLYNFHLLTTKDLNDCLLILWLVGVISWGFNNCAEDGKPSVAGDVSGILPWLHQVIDRGVKLGPDNWPKMDAVINAGGISTLSSYTIFILLHFTYFPFFQVRNGNLLRNQSRPILNGEYFQ